jgi:hypothetical protein
VRRGSTGEPATNRTSGGIHSSSASLLASTPHLLASLGAWISAASVALTATRFLFLAAFSPLADGVAAATLSTSTSGTLRPVTHGRLLSESTGNAEQCAAGKPPGSPLSSMTLLNSNPHVACHARPRPEAASA